jgi:hypothetical protein
MELALAPSLFSHAPHLHLGIRDDCDLYIPIITGLPAGRQVTLLVV